METQNTIHNSWANLYDFVYEQTYGPFYQTFTNRTVDTISKLLQPPGKILDLGAGTGRIAIPLLRMGYEVFPVEISTGMFEVLCNNIQQNGLNCNAENDSISGFKYNNKADLAVCVFTVLIYITSEAEMYKSIQNTAKHIKPGGLFFFDIASAAVFHGNKIRRPSFTRNTQITPDDTAENPNLYIYKENCSGVFNNEPFDYTDEFPLRLWSHAEMYKILTDCGFEDTKKSFPEFNGTGSEYKLFRKMI